MWTGNLTQKREASGGRGKLLTRLYNLRKTMENCGLVSAEHNKQVQHDAVVEETDEGAYICREGIPSKKILLTPVLT